MDARRLRQYKNSEGKKPRVPDYGLNFEMQKKR
jgi:hypothetical protein